MRCRELVRIAVHMVAGPILDHLSFQHRSAEARCNVTCWVPAGITSRKIFVVSLITTFRVLISREQFLYSFISFKRDDLPRIGAANIPGQIGEVKLFLESVRLQGIRRRNCLRFRARRKFHWQSLHLSVPGTISMKLLEGRRWGVQAAMAFGSCKML
jgi:hypothetical protein